jgi:dipeptide/tripeptide permease
MLMNNEFEVRRMLPKWVYYAGANFGVVAMTFLTPLLGPRLPTALGLMVLIVCLIAANLAAWYIQRARARLALATDQAVAIANKPKMRLRTIQFALIGLGLLMLALTMFASLDRITRIENIVCALFGIVLGTLLGIKRKPKSNA